MPVRAPPPFDTYTVTCTCVPQDSTKWESKGVTQNIRTMECTICKNRWNEHSDNDPVWGGPSSPPRGFY